MRRAFWVGLCFIAISLASHVICPTSASAAPTLQSLGRIDEGLSVPTRLDLDAAGNLYVADPRQKSIFIYDKFGTPASEYPVENLSGGALAVTPDGTKIYIACGRSVLILNGQTGQQVGELGNGEETFSATGFIDIGSAGNVYVADTMQRIILIFSPDGTLLGQFGDPASSTGQFASIFALAIDPATFEVYVGDSARRSDNQSKALVFSPDGELLRTLAYDNLSIFGETPLFFFGGITFDQQGHAYFLDTYRSNVRIVQLPQTFQSSLTMPSLLPGNMERPVDAAFDPSTNRLFVACDGGRVEVLGLNGATNPDPNSPPGMPTLLDPIAGGETDSATPQLVFLNASDPDNDVLSYDVRLLRNDELIVQYDDLPQYLPTSFAQVDRALTENAPYSWSARAKDVSTASDWTAEQSFYVNATQEAPGTPQIASPTETPVLDGSGQLTWQASTDPDPFDTVSYLVEISGSDTSFEPIATLVLETTSATLAQLDGYHLFEDGQTCFWRVTALDNHQLASEPSVLGQFIYDTTILRVDADIPGANVYLGGNHAYPGRFIGQVPVEVRDFPVEPCSVVIEKPGFETYVRQVSPAPGTSVAIQATLTPAILPVLKSRGNLLLTTGLTDAAPFIVDYNNDGILDMLVGDVGGILTLYPGLPSDDNSLIFSEGTILDLPLVLGAAPFVLDWDNDGRKDLLLGGDNGTINLFLNRATEAAPGFDQGSLLTASGDPIMVEGRAVPVVIDLDGDLKKDLLVGTGSGDILYYRNLSDDHAPQLAEARLLASVSGAATPFAVDWNADGERDLLITSGPEVFLFIRESGILFSEGQKLSIDIAPSASSLSARHALFAFDADGRKGKDLIIGNQDGSILLFRSNAKKNK